MRGIFGGWRNFAYSNIAAKCLSQASLTLYETAGFRCLSCLYVSLYNPDLSIVTCRSVLYSCAASCAVFDAPCSGGWKTLVCELVQVSKKYGGYAAAPFGNSI